jgi:anti-sigma factor RsiW
VTCSDVLHLVEAVAAGDLEVDDRLRAHLETCPSCASALASARRLEAALQARPSPPAPAQFTTAVIAKIRRDRWRSEERVDRIFNVAIVVAVLLVIGSVVALTNVDAVLGAAGSLWGVLAAVGGEAVEAAAPVVLTYIAAAGLLMSALGMWWWADRRLSL